MLQDLFFRLPKRRNFLANQNQIKPKGSYFDQKLKPGDRCCISKRKHGSREYSDKNCSEYINSCAPMSSEWDWYAGPFSRLLSGCDSLYKWQKHQDIWCQEGRQTYLNSKERVHELSHLSTLHSSRKFVCHGCFSSWYNTRIQSDLPKR